MSESSSSGTSNLFVRVKEISVLASLAIFWSSSVLSLVPPVVEGVPTISSTVGTSPRSSSNSMRGSSSSFVISLTCSLRSYNSKRAVETYSEPHQTSMMELFRKKYDYRYFTGSYPGGIYLLKVNNENNKIMCIQS